MPGPRCLLRPLRRAAALLVCGGTRYKAPKARRTQLYLPRAAAKVEAWISSAHPCLRQAQLAAHDVGAFDKRDALVIRDPPAQPLTAEAAVGSNHESLGWDILERLANQRSDMLRWLDHRVAVVHYTNPNLLIRGVPGEKRQIPPIRAGALEGDHVSMELEKIGESPLITRWLPVDTLLIGIAPAGVDPDLGVHPDELTIKRLGEELEISISTVGSGGATVVRRFFDLDEGTTSGGQFPQLSVKEITQIVNKGSLVPIVLVPEHACQRGGTDGPELHRPI